MTIDTVNGAFYLLTAAYSSGIINEDMWGRMKKIVDGMQAKLDKETDKMEAESDTKVN